MTRLPAVAFAALLLATPLAAQEPALAADSARWFPRLQVLPARPVPGALVRVRIRPATGARADRLPDPARYGGMLAGEPLHFAREADGALVALAGVPIDSLDRITLRLLGDSLDVATVVIALDPPPYRNEQLRVAPEFGREPDSTLAARLERESQRALAVARAAHETPRLWRGRFVRPRPGRVTSGYGNARRFNDVVRSRHMGTDFAGAEGAPIVAVNRGVVRLVDRFHLGGNVVYLDHGAGLVTAYLHLSRTDVAEGDTVRAGQRVGLVGSTGRVTGPHLHLIVRYGTVTVDPMTLLGPLGAAQPARSKPRPPARRATPAKRPAPAR